MIPVFPLNPFLEECVLHVSRLANIWTTRTRGIEIPREILLHVLQCEKLKLRCDVEHNGVIDPYYSNSEQCMELVIVKYWALRLVKTSMILRECCFPAPYSSFSNLTLVPISFVWKVFRFMDCEIWSKRLVSQITRPRHPGLFAPQIIEVSSVFNLCCSYSET